MFLCLSVLPVCLFVCLLVCLFICSTISWTIEKFFWILCITLVVTNSHKKFLRLSPKGLLCFRGIFWLFCYDIWNRCPNIALTVSKLKNTESVPPLLRTILRWFWIYLVMFLHFSRNSLFSPDVFAERLGISVMVAR